MRERNEKKGKEEKGREREERNRKGRKKKREKGGKGEIIGMGDRRSVMEWKCVIGKRGERGRERKDRKAEI